MSIDFILGFGAFTPAVSVSTSTWNPADKGDTITLTNGNRTMTAADASFGRAVRGTQGYSTGKRIVEFQLLENDSNYPWWGLATSSATINAYVTTSGDNQTFVGMYLNDARVYIMVAGSSVYLGTTDFVTGANNLATVTVAADLDADLIWVAFNGGNWNNNGSADPATGTGGWDYSAGPSGTLYPLAGGDAYSPGADSWLLNTGQVAFAKSIPSGFSAWG